MMAYVTVINASYWREAINIWKFDKNVRKLHELIVLTARGGTYYAWGERIISRVNEFAIRK